MFKRSISLFILIAAFTGATLQAATWFIDPAGNDSNGCTGTSDACKGWTRIWAVASGGDTIKVMAGSYNYSGAEITTPDSGSSGAYTIIESTDAWSTDAAGFGPVFSQSNSLNLTHTVHHVKIHGLKFDYAGAKVLRGQHIQMTDCIIRRGSGANVNDARLVVGDSDFNDTTYITLERILIYGAGSRYGFNPFNASNIVARELVLRADGGWTDVKGDPEGPVSLYNTTGTIVADTIILDSTQTTGVTFSGNQFQGFYVVRNPGSAGPQTDNILIKQVIEYNVQGVGFRNDGTYASGTSVQYQDIAAVNVTAETIATIDTAISLNRFTFGGMGSFASTAGAFYGGSNLTAKNGILFNWSSGYGSGSLTITSSTFYNSGSAPSGGGNNTTNPFTAGLLYPTRTEAASTMFTTGESGGPRGAQIVYQFGTRGTEYGETGYATLTATPLWPTVHQARWKTELASNVSRGFSAGSKDLCTYINDALGNDSSTLCSASVTPPTAPRSLSIGVGKSFSMGAGKSLRFQ
jgi:hypothetical protein